MRESVDFRRDSRRFLAPQLSKMAAKVRLNYFLKWPVFVRYWVAIAFALSLRPTGDGLTRPNALKGD
jgi:hypothetical protein